MVQVLQTIKFVTSVLSSTFPDKKIVFTMGNDDFYPNYYMPYETDWEYFQSLFTKGGLGDILQDPSEAQTFLKGGYYKTRMPGTKFTVFSLNTLAYSKKRKSEIKKFESLRKLSQLNHENDPFDQVL